MHARVVVAIFGPAVLAVSLAFSGSGATRGAGEQGPVGPPGPAASPAAVLSGDTPAAGQTITGSMAFSYTADAVYASSGMSFQYRVQLPAAPTGAYLQGTGGCSTVGTAPSGTLCFYPSRQLNLLAVTITANEVGSGAPALNTADRDGFLFQLTASNPGLTLWRGSYAYSVP